MERCMSNNMKYRLEIKNVSFLWSERKYISKAINKH